MYARNILPILVITILLSMSGVAAAHSPTSSGGNESLDSAMHIDAPLKSWAIYARLHEAGEANYYRFDLEMGDRLVINLFVPHDNGFLPKLVLIGPGVEDQGILPGFIEVPEGAGHELYEPDLGNPSFEPFTPAANYMLVDIDTKAPGSGTYYIVIFEEGMGGNYGLAVGYIEEFTLTEWLGIPLQQIIIYQWEGQDLATIAAPGMIASLGFIAMALYHSSSTRKRLSPFQLSGIFVASIFIGTAVNLTAQTARGLSMNPDGASGASVTFMYVLASALLAGLMYITVKRSAARRPIITRAFLIIVAVLGVSFWSGIYLGPILALMMVFIPIEHRPSKAVRRKGEGTTQEEE